METGWDLERIIFSGTKTLLEEFGNSKVNAELKKKSEFIEKLSAMDKTNDALLIREGKMNGADADIDMTHVAEGYIPVAVTNVSDSIVNNLQGLVLTVWTEDGQADVTWYELNPDEEGNYAGVIDLSRFNYKPGTYYVNVRAVEQSKREYDINCNGDQCSLIFHKIFLKEERVMLSFYVIVRKKTMNGSSQRRYDFFEKSENGWGITEIRV